MVNRAHRGGMKGIVAMLFPGPEHPQRGLTWALSLSFLLHALLLTLHFSFPEHDSQRRSSNLEVVLVNSKSAHRPKDAQVLAQANLDAGGNTEDNRVASSPLAPTRREQNGDMLLQQRRRVQELEQQQKQLMVLAREKSPPAPVAPPEPPKTTQPEPVVRMSGIDLAESALAMARLEAKIAKEVEAYNKRPRVNHFGTRAASAVEAQYVEDWRLKVERVGNLNYPEEARGKLYGSLVLVVGISSDGSVQSVEVTKSSGHKVLDNAAKRIVRMASPYAVFPPELKRSFDILEITRTWTFSKSDMLQSN